MNLTSEVRWSPSRLRVFRGALLAGAAVLLLHVQGFLAGADEALLETSLRFSSPPGPETTPVVIAAGERSVAAFGLPPWDAQTWQIVADGLGRAGIREVTLVDPWTSVLVPTSRALPGRTPSAEAAILRIPTILLPAATDPNLPVALAPPDPGAPFAADTRQIWLPTGPAGEIRDLTAAALAGDVFGPSIFCDWNGACPSGGPLSVPLHPLSEHPGFVPLELVDVVMGLTPPLDATAGSGLVMLGLTDARFARQVRIGPQRHPGPWVEAVASAVSSPRGRSPTPSLAPRHQAFLVGGLGLLGAVASLGPWFVRAEVLALALPMLAALVTGWLAARGILLLPMASIMAMLAAPPLVSTFTRKRLAEDFQRRLASLVARANLSPRRAVSTWSTEDLQAAVFSLTRHQLPGCSVAWILPPAEGEGPTFGAGAGLSDAHVEPLLARPRTLRRALRKAPGVPWSPDRGTGLTGRVLGLRQGRRVLGWWVLAWPATEEGPAPNLVARLARHLVTGWSWESPAPAAPTLRDLLQDPFEASLEEGQRLLVEVSADRAFRHRAQETLGIPTLVADATGALTFQNPSASRLFGAPGNQAPTTLRDLLVRLQGEPDADRSLARLVLGLDPLEIDWTDGEGRAWRATLAPVLPTAGQQAGPPLGFVAWLELAPQAGVARDQEPAIRLAEARIHAGLAAMHDRVDYLQKVVKNLVHQATLGEIASRADDVRRGLTDLLTSCGLTEHEDGDEVHDLRMVLREAVRAANARAEGRRGMVRLELEPEALQARLAPEGALPAMNALLSHLVDTADPGTAIAVQVQEHRGRETIRIQVPGRGLDPTLTRVWSELSGLGPEGMPAGLQPFGTFRELFPSLALASDPSRGLVLDFQPESPRARADTAVPPSA